ncbi:questin oxidase family protein [Streptomyces sp. NBC_00335]|uniref:questin oxidase family protein n=1 Tax=unclassified Streptomyces TaxID=2593676 RepID=UPI00224DEE26|nr:MULTISPECIES: questin oxidase family protein [unclassified Streptomyces]MCX5402487.1 questin oxidase family protein [Streptomyces sp. NBC_00086]
MDTTGILDEALQRLHGSGPERLGRLTNHAPMAVEALSVRGQAGTVHRWLDLYASRLEEFPTRVEPVTAANWHVALGDPRRAADWIDFFEREITDRPWRDVLAQWWPRLLPGMYGGSTHPLIRVGHAVRTLLAGEHTAPRLAELAHGLGYWAARHHPVADLARLPGAGGDGAAVALDAVRPITERDGSFPDRLRRVTGLPMWAATITDPTSVPDPDQARLHLVDLVRAATHRYATHGHGEETMLVHAATAPNAVLRTLPALPPALWAPSLRAAWTASAAVTAMYAPDAPVAFTPPGTFTSEEVFERALAHGDEHVIKLTDTALDIGDGPALAAALRSMELTEPLR